jgi:RimJ/RimL family protein N-acetyltransferase
VNLKGPPLEAGEVEIGWGIVPEARGQGFATEASRAVIEWAVSVSKVRRVSATIPETNAASQNVARRLGMSRTEEVRRGLPLWVMNP